MRFWLPKIIFRRFRVQSLEQPIVVGLPPCPSSYRAFSHHLACQHSQSLYLTPGVMSFAAAVMEFYVSEHVVLALNYFVGLILSGPLFAKSSSGEGRPSFCDSKDASLRQVRKLCGASFLVVVFLT